MERISEHAIANRIYDDFEPLSNWKTEQGFEALTVYLPGFRKEQLKVQITTTRKLRVMGDRPSGANKWIRFRKEFPIPPNVDVDSVSAKFEGANLVVRLPRPEPMGKQDSPSSGTTAKPPLVPKDNYKPPSPAAKEKAQPSKEAREKEAELEKQAEKVQSPKPGRENEEALKAAAKEGTLNQDYRSKVNAYKENLGGYVALLKNNRTALTAGLVIPAAAVLLLSLGFYAGQMFTSY
ncbi:PREDICTED: inactive protein RESTRICTED TEV MOVEMENT 2-like [Camelina sativa]|uniref:Inactive protein RESTRICTED TEV MOVEMENT 2-like n=1 Tax=Camelina sativa TaxID=90675 RepID=A0ABM0SY83_CAMSA|nr:PREDICTED: inactive protein RESTRICTED TEV MOVEMENT 2-like [Camelina sativa]